MAMVRFHDPSHEPEEGLTYSVIAARCYGKWIFVRHHDRSTWEIPGGHIEGGESPHTTARRELTEETGAEEFTLDCVATYSVEKNGTTGSGRLFFAEVTNINPLPPNSEVAEIIMLNDLPDNLTYPDIQPYLFRRVLDFLKTAAGSR